jgi:hypothetical protein
MPIPNQKEQTPVSTNTNTHGREPRSAATALILAAAGIACFALLASALGGHHLLEAHALKAAGGFKDVKPIEGVGNFIDALKGNLSWLFITALILVIVTVGFLFMAGHHRAHDYALRVVIGCAIVACASGIVA